MTSNSDKIKEKCDAILNSFGYYKENLSKDLSKAFDCICHDLLIAKIHAYGLSLPALKIIQDYLMNRKQRTKIGSSWSSWEEIVCGAPDQS